MLSYLPVNKYKAVAQHYLLTLLFVPSRLSRLFKRAQLIKILTSELNKGYILQHTSYLWRIPRKGVKKVVPN